MRSISFAVAGLSMIILAACSRSKPGPLPAAERAPLDLHDDPALLRRALSIEGTRLSRDFVLVAARVRRQSGELSLVIDAGNKSVEVVSLPTPLAAAECAEAPTSARGLVFVGEPSMALVLGESLRVFGYARERDCLVSWSVGEPIDAVPEGDPLVELFAETTWGNTQLGTANATQTRPLALPAAGAEQVEVTVDLSNEGALVLRLARDGKTLAQREIIQCGVGKVSVTAYPKGDDEALFLVDTDECNPDWESDHHSDLIDGMYTLVWKSGAAEIVETSRSESTSSTVTDEYRDEESEAETQRRSWRVGARVLEATRTESHTRTVWRECEEATDDYEEDCCNRDVDTRESQVSLAFAGEPEAVSLVDVDRRAEEIDNHDCQRFIDEAVKQGRVGRRNKVGYLPATATPEELKVAADRCEDTNVVGFLSFRLPTVPELETLLEAKAVPDGTYWTGDHRTFEVLDAAIVDAASRKQRAPGPTDRALTVCVTSLQ